jgi:hypothetical protein
MNKGTKTARTRKVRRTAFKTTNINQKSINQNRKENLTRVESAQLQFFSKSNLSLHRVTL